MATPILTKQSNSSNSTLPASAAEYLTELNKLNALARAILDRLKRIVQSRDFEQEVLEPLAGHAAYHAAVDTLGREVR